MSSTTTNTSINILDFLWIIIHNWNCKTKCPQFWLTCYYEHMLLLVVIVNGFVHCLFNFPWICADATEVRRIGRTTVWFTSVRAIRLPAGRVSRSILRLCVSQQTAEPWAWSHFTTVFHWEKMMDETMQGENDCWTSAFL